MNPFNFMNKSSIHQSCIICLVAILLVIVVLSCTTKQKDKTTIQNNEDQTTQQMVEPQSNRTPTHQLRQTDSTPPSIESNRIENTIPTKESTPSHVSTDQTDEFPVEKYLDRYESIITTYCLKVDEMANIPKEEQDAFAKEQLQPLLFEATALAEKKPVHQFNATYQQRLQELVKKYMECGMKAKKLRLE
jgi:competence protein ComGC